MIYIKCLRKCDDGVVIELGRVEKGEALVTQEVSFYPGMEFTICTPGETDDRSAWCEMIPLKEEEDGQVH